MDLYEHKIFIDEFECLLDDIMCPFCEYGSVELQITPCSTYYSCSCGGNWEVIN